MPDTNRPGCSDSASIDVLPMSHERLARIAKALAHPERVRILEMFAESRPLMAHEIAAGSTLAQSTISEHLRILRRAGVVAVRRDGPRTWYCMQRPVLEAFTAATRGLTQVTDLEPIG